MLRRHLLKGAAALPFAAALASPVAAMAAPLARRVRPTDPAWPSAQDWAELKQAVGGNLVEPKTVWATCEAAPGAPECLASLKWVRDPFYLGDQAGGTQVSGWLDAWTPKASACAVAAHSTADVATRCSAVMPALAW